MGTQNPFASPNPVLEGKSLALNPRAFNISQILTWSANRSYRVYPVGESLYFTYLGKATGAGDAVAIQFGLAGMLFLWLSRRSATKKEAEKSVERDQLSPEDLLTEHKHNFKLDLVDIQEAAIEARAWTGGAYQQGRCNVTLKDNKKLAFEFATVEQMQKALEQLPTILGDRLQVRVEWDFKKKRYKKLKAA